MSSPESASSSSDRYSGIWKVRWLIRQAQNSPSSEIRQEALSKALNLIQHEWIDSQLLENVCAQFSIPLDRQLTRKKNIAFFEQQKRLTEELDLRKRALRKEKIRSSLHELAQLLYRRGLFEKAANKYLEAKKNAINEEEKMESIWCAIEAAVAADSFGHIIPICNQILTQKDARIPNDMFSRFHAILALKDFKQGNLSQACQHFLKAAQNLQTDANLAQIFSFPFATAQDIGMYTGFLCMCSLSRSDLGSIALRNRVVRSLIEQSPQTFNCCQKFYDGKYAEALDMIRKIGSEVLSVDWFACKVISKVQDCIRTEMFYLYTKPFSVVDMKEMAKALNIESPELESELVDLIDKNVLPFRVDSVQSLLVLKKTDESLLAYTDALKASDDFLSTARSALLNQSLLTHNIVIADGDTISHIPTCGVNSEKPQKGALISSISSLI